jgi:hypothetical protein
MSKPTPKDLLASRVERSAEKAVDAIDALIKDLQEHRESVLKWAAGEPAREPKVYGNRLTDAVDSIADFRATVQTAHYASLAYEGRD